MAVEEDWIGERDHRNDMVCISLKILQISPTSTNILCHHLLENRHAITEIMNG